MVAPVARRYRVCVVVQTALPSCTLAAPARTPAPIPAGGAEPAQAWKTREVVIERNERGAVRDGERGKVGVGGEVSGGAGLREEPVQVAPVFVGLADESDGRLGQPAADVAARLLDGERSGLNYAIE